METIGSVAKLQAENIIRGSVGVQSPSDFPAANEAVLSPQHYERPVDQLHQELLRLSYRTEKSMSKTNRVNRLPATLNRTNAKRGLPKNTFLMK